MGYYKPRPYRYFNPRSRKGFDLSTGVAAPSTKISIHEAAKASTQKRMKAANNLYFNPRSRKGFDVDSISGLADTIEISIHEAAKASTAKTSKKQSHFTKQFIHLLYYPHSQ